MINNLFKWILRIFKRGNMDYQQECIKGHQHFKMIEKDVVESVIANLKKLEQGQWTLGDDDVFAPFTEYMFIMKYIGMSLRPILTLDAIDAQILSTEAIIGRSIHKGAYYYNTGLCYFLSSDFTHFLQFLNEASDEDTRTYGSATGTVFVNHHLSEQALIEPWRAWFNSICNNIFKTITKADLTLDNIKKLIDYLAKDRNKLESVLLFYKTIYGISASQVGTDNTATALNRVRALADLVLVYENTINSLHFSTDRQLFHKTVEYLTNIDNSLVSEFNRLHSSNPADDPDKNTALDNLLKTLTPAIVTKTDRNEIVSTAFLISYRLRNNLMHVLENSVAVYIDKDLCNNVFAIVLSNLYLVMLVENGESIL